MTRQSAVGTDERPGTRQAADIESPPSHASVIVHCRQVLPKETFNSGPNLAGGRPSMSRSVVPDGNRQPNADLDAPPNVRYWG